MSKGNSHKYQSLLILFAAIAATVASSSRAWSAPLEAEVRGRVSLIVLVGQADSQRQGGSGAESSDSPPPEDAAPTEGDAAPPTPRVLDRSTPRATMREFLIAVQDAAGDQPDRIRAAVRCLDVSELTGDDVDDRARQLARRLQAVIDTIGVKLDDIPEQVEGDQGYVFFSAPDPDNALKDVEIRLARDPDSDQWRFTADTLAAVPTLEKVVAKEKQAEPPPTGLDLPAPRRSPRATMKTFLEAMIAEPRDMGAAIRCLDPTAQDPRGWKIRGEQLAIRLKNVMDKTRLVVYSDIPESPTGGPYVWLEEPTIGKIVIGPATETTKVEGAWDVVQGEWRFTPDTLKTIDALYEAYRYKPIIPELRAMGVEEELTFSMKLERRVPPELRGAFLGLALWKWLALAVLIAIGWVIKIVVAVIAGLILRVVLRRRHITIERDLIRRAVSSTGYIFVVLFWTMVINRQYLELPDTWSGPILVFLKFGLVATMLWAGYRIVDVIGGYITGNRDVRLTGFDELLVPLLRQVFRALVLIVVVLFALDYFLNYTPKTVLGALGIGGVAIAFAAKDTLGNFFGSITVLVDRPFGPGDWVVVAGVEGTVEKVGFRSTRLRTFYNSLVTIPNSSMVNSNVDNYGLRRYRRAKTMISITYGTPPEKINAFCEGIRELIRLHPYTRKDYYHVYFNQFAASSLDILLYIFFDAPDWSTELRERHRLFVDIIRLANRLGVEFAFPTQTIMLERGTSAADRDKPDARIEPGQDADTIGLQHAAKVFEEAYGAEPERPGPVLIDMVPRSKRDKPG